MKRLIAWSIFLISTGFSAWANQDFGLPFIRYYSSQEYQAGIQNWHISQDSRGIIYVANNFGLLEFDGSEWRLFEISNGVKLRHFNLHPDNRIAIASQGQFGYLITNEYGQWIYKSLSDQLPAVEQDFEETWKVFHFDGVDYFCTSNKIFKVENQSIDIIRSEHDITSFFQINHQIVVYMPEIGLFVLKDDKFLPINNQKQILNKWISEILPLPNNRMLIITKASGAFIIDAESNNVWQADQQKVLSKASVNAAIKLSNGDYAIGTQNTGLLIYSPEGELKNHLTKGRGLENRTIICLFEDRQGNLWAGHNNGISYIEFGQPFSFLNENIGLPGTGYDGIQVDDEMYLATNNGLFKSIRSNDNTNISFQLIPNTQGQVYHVNNLGGLFVVGHNNGPYTFTHDNDPKLLEEGGTWIFQPLNSNNNYIISGTYDGLELYLKKPTTLQFKWQIDGFDESCRIFEQDDSDNIWMTHGYKGVFKFSLSKDLKSIQNVKFYGVNNGLPSNRLISVYHIRNELVFTTMDGIYQYDEKEDRFVKDAFYSEFFEPDTPINILVEDADENIYFLGQTEIGVLKKDPTGQYIKKVDSFNKIRGMLNDDLQNISILQSFYPVLQEMAHP